MSIDPTERSAPSTAPIDEEGSSNVTPLTPGDDAPTVDLEAPTAPIEVQGSTPLAPENEGPTLDREAHKAPIDEERSAEGTPTIPSDIVSTSEHLTPPGTDALTPGSDSMSSDGTATAAELTKGAADVQTSPAVAADEKAIAPISTKVPSAFRSILGPRPCCAGEDPREYDQLLELVIEPWEPQALREFQLLKTIADCEWMLLRLGNAKTFTFNAVIAKTLLARIVNNYCEQELQRMATEGKILNKGDAALELQFSQQLHRFWRRTALAAVLGDRAAIQEVERKIGPGTVMLDVFAADEFDASIDTQLQMERLIQAAQTRRDLAYDALERHASKRSKRQQPTETPRAGDGPVNGRSQ